MFQTLKTILSENWQWRGQIGHLAVFELRKQARGAALGWLWIAIKPLVFIVVFWFALEVGLRAGEADPDATYPYFLWLVSGLIPWFFMQSMLSTGSDVLHRYKYLVNKVKFPLSGISTLYVLSELLVSLILFVLLFAIYVGYGMQWDIYLLQVPFLILLMALFWDMFSIMSSELCGFSKDLAQLIKALTQPFFWLSGIIFNMNIFDGTAFAWLPDVMAFNPVTFFAYAFRDAFCYKVWFWEDPMFIGGFIVVFVITFIGMLLAYKNLRGEVADVL